MGNLLFPISIRLAGVIALGALPAGCGEGEDAPASWPYISAAIIQPNCATSSCHSRGAAVAGIDLSAVDVGWESLTSLHVARKNRAAAPARPLVTPFIPNQSRLVRMLRGDGAAPMPPDRPLPIADIELVERWILDGAKSH